MTLVLASPQGGSGSGGASQFTGLTDTPANYTGQALKGVRVNSGETALEYYTPTDENDAAVWGNVTGTLSDQTDLQSALDGKATSAQGALADSALQVESDTLQTVTDRGATSTTTITLSPSGNNDALVASGSGSGDGVNIVHGGSGASLNITHSGSGDEIVVNTNEFVVSGGNITLSGTVDGRDIATDGSKLDGIEAGADVTDATNVASAGALMASNNLSDLANTTTARTNLGVDVAGTDNSTNVTLTGQDYLTLSGQEITANQIDLASDVTGTLPLTNVATIDDSDVTASASATNYTPTASTVEGHLAGIDTALGASGGGGVSKIVHARRSSTIAISGSTKTKVVFNQEEFDDDGVFNTSTGRYSPNEAGKYYISGLIQFSNITAGASVFIYVQVNSTEECFQQFKAANVSNSQAFPYQAVVNLGASDYVEIYTYNSSSSPSINGQSGKSRTHFNAFKIA